MKNKLFSLVLLLLFILGIGILVLPQYEVSLQERRWLNQSSDIRVIDLVQSTDDVLNDQFYSRSKILELYYLSNATLSSTFGSNKIDNITITPISDEIDLLNDGYISNKPLAYNDADLKAASLRGYNINEFDLKYPNIKTYIYKCTRVEELLNIEYPFQEKCWDALTIQLNPNISYSELSVESIQDYQKYFYKTDVHWNAYGAYQGYVDIINMINNDFNIGEPKKAKEFITFPYKFKGNVSSKIAFLGDYDYLTDCVLDNVGDFDYYVDGELFDFYEDKNEYIENGNSQPYSDYEIYFGTNTFMKLFDFHDDDKPNLLIFSTSYTNANNMWIASHFNKTLLIDLRNIDEDFSLEYYIDKYDISIALMETSYRTLFLNGYLFIPVD